MEDDPCTNICFCRESAERINDLWGALQGVAKHLFRISFLRIEYNI